MKRSLLLLSAAVLLTITACKKHPQGPTKILKLNITGLQDLGKNFKYEGWLIVQGMPFSSGRFMVDSAGRLSPTQFSVPVQVLDHASAFVVTIEPQPDPDPAPSKTHILGGSFMKGMAMLSVGDALALGNDFMGAWGKYILATPTNGANTNENSGIWWLDPAKGPGPGLMLPALPDGWMYEGWVVMNGWPVTTGKFMSANGADEAAPFSGPMPGPPFPGEDFLQNAPSGLSFPTDLSGDKAVISIEPDPDNSPMPFLLKPLVGDIPAHASDHTVYMMKNNATSFPSGMVSIKQ